VSSRTQQRSGGIWRFLTAHGAENCLSPLLPRLYAIIDIELLAAHSLNLASFATELRDAGIKLVQYRNKKGSTRNILNDTAQLREIFPSGGDVQLLLNDRADLALLANCNGVHVGQEDLTIKDARSIIGEHRWVGASTHSPQQIIEADQTSCTYIAYGPIFATTSKNNPDPTVGLEGLRIARSLTQKPLVAIGGITRENCRAVIDAGADSVAIISNLLPKTGQQSTRQIAEEFLALLC
jgi:thiamine-phosphate pyrophosphorylase